MPDLSDENQRIATAANVVNEINQYAATMRPNRYKTRLAPSSLGEECAAATWYGWRWAVAPGPANGRMARYNSLGDIHEDRMAGWLSGCGWSIDDKDEKGQQYAVKDFAGHLYGKIDGIGAHEVHTNSQPVLLEYKYINYKRFTTLTSKPLKVVDQKYYGQICLYMFYLNLDYTFWFPGNRNDDDIKPIIIPRDDSYARDLIRKGEHIMYQKVRPARIAESPAFHICKHLCDYTDVCHNGKPLAINCRSCVNCVPIEDGKFKCERWNATIPSKEAILAACPSYTPVA